MIKLISNQLDLFESDIKESSLSEVLEYISGVEEVSLDIETTGLNPEHNTILMVQVGDENNQFVIDIRNLSKDTRDSFMATLGDILSKKIVLGHNLKFDLKFLKAYHDWELQDIYDTYLAERVLHCGKLTEKEFYGLGNVCYRYTKNKLDKEVRGKFVSLEGKPFKRHHIVYGAMDIKYLQKIKRKQMQKISRLKLENIVKLENQLVKVLISMELSGILLDTDKWLKNVEDNTGLLKQTRKILESIILEDKRFDKFIIKQPQLSLFEQFKPVLVGINWDSPDQVLEVLQCISTSIESTDQKKLGSYNGEPLIDNLVHYRQINKELTTYGENFLNSLSKDGRIRTIYNQIMNTGRLSSGDKKQNLPNLQNIPKKDVYRNSFIAKPGYKIAALDFSGQEVVIAADISKEDVWVEAIKEGKDVHSMVAEMMFKELWKETAEDNCEYYKSQQKCDCKKHKPLRFIAKTINFGSIYGMQANKLYEQVTAEVPEMGYTQEQARKDLQLYHKTLTKISKMVDNFGNFAQQNGYIRTKDPFRRYRFFDKPELDDTRREAGNFPIQATGANMVKLAMINVYNFLKNNEDFDCKLIHQVHDELIFEVKEEHLEQIGDLLRIMQETAAKFVDLPMTCSVEIDNFWKK